MSSLTVSTSYIYTVQKGDKKLPEFGEVSRLLNETGSALGLSLVSESA